LHKRNKRSDIFFNKELISLFFRPSEKAHMATCQSAFTETQDSAEPARRLIALRSGRLNASRLKSRLCKHL